MAQTAFILVVTPDEIEGQRLRELLHEGHGHSCRVAPTIDEALDSIRTRSPDVVVADCRKQGVASGQPIVDLLDSLSRDSTAVLIGPGESPDARHIRVTCLDSPARLEDVSEPIAQVAAKSVSRRQDILLRRTLEEHRADSFEGIVGISREIKRITAQIAKAAPTNLTVLILGETGVGKELIAEAIHKQSPRARKTFKAVNCAGLNENLLESELFGHVKGAFTGAVSDYKGYFVAADGGTLFLDEIGDMPLVMQAKLLRALETREVTPVGSTDSRKVDVRVVAATHANLHDAVEEKKFRADLYYRLNQWVIHVPALRERRDDIPLLVDHFLRIANKRHGTQIPGVSSEAMQHLSKYFWPGNVRELSNTIERLAVEVGGRQIEADDLPEPIRGTRDIVPAGVAGFVGLSMAEVERMMIERTLQATHGNREQAAKILNIGTRTLYRKLKEYGLG
ncbi:MAG: sigma-54-dependent Fis family transcriptional regulator [Phycisphaerales bacterium]|nr:sigma-54-dependent Fis family transcriptional regulator [Phycisphaerales bacterium]